MYHALKQVISCLVNYKTYEAAAMYHIVPLSECSMKQNYCPCMLLQLKPGY